MNSENLFIATAQAQETAKTTSTSAGAFGMFMPMILIFVIFYFLLIRPQNKQRKEHQKLVSELKKGDEVITTSGIHGKVAGVSDKIATVEIADNVRIKIEKQQIATVTTVSKG